MTARQTNTLDTVHVNAGITGLDESAGLKGLRLFLVQPAASCTWIV
jgi:hypothetical protein